MMYSTLLRNYPEIQHGYTTKKDRLFNSDHILFPRQNHTTNVSIIKDFNSCDNKHVDGVVTQARGLTIGVKTADCVPILLYDPKLYCIAALHAGWRGTLGDIVGKLIQKLICLGAHPSRIIASIGPSICPTCYTVDANRSELFLKKGYDYAVDYHAGHIHVSLQDINKQQLIARGIFSSHIEIIPYCTSCHNTLLYSLRREKQKLSSQMISFISLQH